MFIETYTPPTHTPPPPTSTTTSSPALVGSALAALLLGLLLERLVQIRHDTAVGDGGVDNLVELLVAADGEEEVAGLDALRLLRLGRRARELNDLRGQILEKRGAVNGGGGAAALLSKEALLEPRVHAANGEVELCPGGTRQARTATGLAARLPAALALALPLAADAALPAELAAAHNAGLVGGGGARAHHGWLLLPGDGGGVLLLVVTLVGHRAVCL